MNQHLYGNLCHMTNLMIAWTQLRANAENLGLDRFDIEEYERFLQINLDDLAARLRRGSYRPVSTLTGESSDRALGEIEDLIVQQTARNVTESALGHSPGLRPIRDARTAIMRVLEHRARGDSYVVGSEIANLFDRHYHDDLLRLLSARITDGHLIDLISMWLSRSRTAPDFQIADDQEESLRIAELLNEYLVELIGATMTRRLDGQYPVNHFNRSFRIGGENVAIGEEIGSDDVDSAGQVIKRMIRQFSRDAALVILTSSTLAYGSETRVRRLATPKSIALTGAALLAKAAYPAAAKALHDKIRPRRMRAVEQPSDSRKQN